jgi:tetratricopeptide (TPR) repeat protein
MDESVIPDNEFHELLSKGAAYLAAANGIESEMFGPWVQQKVPPDVGVPAAELRATGVEFFQHAARLKPNEPWIWYVIGWNQFAYEDGPCEREAAYDALLRVLELQPDHAPAHLALAWLLYGEEDEAIRDTPGWAETVWQGEIGEHLRAGLAFESLYCNNDGFGFYMKVRGERRWFSGWGALLGIASIGVVLDALYDVVPEEFRFAFYMAYGCLSRAREDQLRWYEEALRWPSEDVLGKFFAHYWLWRSRPKEDLIREFEHVLGAYDALRRLNDSPLCYGFNDAVCLLWYPVNASRNMPPEAIPRFLEVVDTYLDMLDTDWFLLDDFISLSYCGELTSQAGCLLLESDPRRAKQYFERARSFEDELVELDDYHPAEEGDIDNPRSWRVVLARGLRDIYLDDLDVEEAKAENERILKLFSMDEDARHFSPRRKIYVAPSGSTEIADRLEEIQTTQKLLLAEVKLQSSAMERLAQIRENISTMTQERQLRVGEINDLVGQLHDLVQKGYQIPPTTWSRAHQRVMKELGKDTYDQLQPDSQDYVITAEVVFLASENLPDAADAALIAIEYSKVVETELRRRFLPVLARFLEDSKFRGDLSIGADDAGKKRYRGPGTWSRELPNLTMGAAIYLLDKAVSGNQNPKVHDFMEHVEPHPGWARNLVEDLKTVVHRYRNGAAHIERMNRQTLEEFRNLLFDGRLLRRIVELEQHAEKSAAV